MSQEIDYLAMAEFLKPRGYAIRDESLTFPGGLMCFCADTEEAYQMAFGHFLAGELGRKWKESWAQDKLGYFYEQVFSVSEFLAITDAIQYYEQLEGNKEK